MKEDSRGEPSWPVLLPMQVQWRRTTATLMAEQASARGVLVRVAAPPELRELLHVTTTLPSDGRQLVAHGMAVRVERVQPRGAHVELHFYGLDHEARARWASFLQQLRTEHRPNDATATSGAADRREFARYHAALKLELSTLDELHTVYSRDVSEGGMYIATELKLPVGASLPLYVVHPRTGRRFAIEAVVRRHGRAPDPPGLGVEFLHMTPQRRAEFIAFVRGSLLIDDDAPPGTVPAELVTPASDTVQAPPAPPIVPAAPDVVDEVREARRLLRESR